MKRIKFASCWKHVFDMTACLCAVMFVCSAARAGETIGAVCDRPGINCLTGERRVVSRAEWGKDWPFTTEEAVLVCVHEIGRFGQLFVVGGLPWAANGASQGYARHHGLTMEVNGKALPVRTFDPDEDARVEKLWAEAPRPEGWSDDDPWGARVDIGIVIITLSEMGCT